KNAVRLMTGFVNDGPGPLVSYRGLGRNFAALVLRADAANVRVVVYNFDQQTQNASLVPWILKQGDEFELLIGPDENDDGRPDRVTESRKFRLESTGQDVPFRIDGRSQLVLEIRRLSLGSEKPLLADLAVSSADIQFRPEFQKIDVAVHNIGAAPARNLT